MRDFMIAALPWIIIGIAVAVIFAFRSRKKDDEPQNCMTEGMCIGMCLGVGDRQYRSYQSGIRNKLRNADW